jgi:hypothetical protein
MKQIKFLALGIIVVGTALLMNSCCKKKTTTTTPPASQIVKFDLPFQDSSYLPTLSILPIPVDLTADSLFSYQFATYSDSLFKQNNSSAAKIISVKCNSLIMSQYDNTKNLDFIKDIKMFVANKDGSNKVLIGSKIGIPLNSTSVNLDLTGAELKSYMIADTFRLVVGGTIRANSTIPPNSFLSYLASFHCEANP